MCPERRPYWRSKNCTKYLIESYIIYVRINYNWQLWFDETSNVDFEMFLSFNQIHFQQSNVYYISSACPVSFSIQLYIVIFSFLILLETIKPINSVLAFVGSYVN